MKYCNSKTFFNEFEYQFYSISRQTASKNGTLSGVLNNTSPIYHDTSEEQKRAQAYIIAGYVPFGHHLEKVKENITLKSGSENIRDLPNIQDLYLSQQSGGEYSNIDFDEDFPDYCDEFDPYSFDSNGLAGGLPDLITDLSSITREKRDYPGRIDHTIRLNKKAKIHTEGRVLSATLKGIASGEDESNQSIPSKFSSIKDPKKALGKMATSVNVGGPKGQGDRNLTVGEGSQHGSQPPSHEGSQFLQQSSPSYKISDLIDPSLNVPLKHHQQVTFRLVKQGKRKKHQI